MTDRPFSTAGQLPLAIALDAEATFDNFAADTTSELAVDWLKDNHESAGGYLFGGAGSGKSHLLQASCAATTAPALYIPLAEFADYPAAQVLDGIDALSLVALDDIDRIAGDSSWEEALFHAFNLCVGSGTRLLVSASSTASQIDFTLADLQSRLGSLAAFRLPRPDDDSLERMLDLRAGHRGITLSAEVKRYIVTRAPRDSHAVMALLEKLDTAALARHRLVTIPLIKELKLLSPDR
ncbi:DnaA regulatory inactivator Hda [Luminiphilus syltensis NOR5-1B]|uniref:DnaA regulatory inactivator Hda n=1 Tax=Luminiphilus syltensis NOR5-1B TaxID=565045 RepID=B8KQC7_9GAMM|nr:DnaA regulatory inactivator Hda [Luminiphilus syltensis]EED36475.1 DnaA regulatory inactivator Hda [Luminiphilus syltensis NOR5-1B]